MEVEGRCLRGAKAGNGCGKGGTGGRGGRLVIWCGVWWAGTWVLQGLMLGRGYIRCCGAGVAQTAYRRLVVRLVGKPGRQWPAAR